MVYYNYLDMLNWKLEPALRFHWFYSKNSISKFSSRCWAEGIMQQNKAIIFILWPVQENMEWIKKEDLGVAIDIRSSFFLFQFRRTIYLSILSFLKNLQDI